MSSPIEEALLAAVRLAASRHNVFLVDSTARPAEAVFEPTLGNLLLKPRNEDPNDEQEWVEHHGANPDTEPKAEEWHLWRDVMIESYKIDFVLDTGYESLAIECDGHDFHDRTKQQAAYDRARDRFLLAHGLSTVRFTGSEIVHSKEKCAEEIYQILRVLHRRGAALAHSGFSCTGVPYRRDG
jgi:very-short-patch-repair endonuclease